MGWGEGAAAPSHPPAAAPSHPPAAATNAQEAGLFGGLLDAAAAAAFQPGDAVELFPGWESFSEEDAAESTARETAAQSAPP